MNPIKYYIGQTSDLAIAATAVWQAGRIWNSMPKLPEANLDLIGQIGRGKKKLKVLALGESTIAGVGVDSHKKGITGYLASSLSKQLKR